MQSKSFRKLLLKRRGTAWCWAGPVLGLICFISFPGLPARAQSEMPQAAVTGAIQHPFVFVADKPLHSVSVAGTFNGWNKNSNPMKVDADGRTWRLTLPLEYGRHLYKFVLDGEDWVIDPKAARNETDADGHTNSLLPLQPEDYRVPASPNDGITASSALLHQPNTPYLNYDRGTMTFSLRVRPGDLRQVSLRESGRSYPMRVVKSDELYAVYQGALPWDRTKNLDYVFELQDGARKERFGAEGLKAGSRPFEIKAKSFKPFEVPQWVEHAVFYQIFPDRFANGDKANDPTNVQAWDSKPEGMSRFGGDAAGVRQHLPYIKDLGISAVYFNPVFKSPVAHRYETEDYKQIDPEFGTNAEFAALTKEMDKQGIRTVLDFVFNHTATTFAPFQDVARRGEASPYKDWYFIKSYPVKVGDPNSYVAWWNYPSMPKLNVVNPAARDYLLNVVDFWHKEIPLGGLRLDVADEVDPRFWRNLRQRVKGLDSQMWIVGETWNNGARWLGGDQWDSVMNYPFLFANVDFFAEGKTSASQFTERLMSIYNWYPPQVSRNMMNLLSSHDRPRFLTLCKNDARLAQLAATVQFTWVGAPSIYYGEEIGMEGGADPDNRRGMTWDRATLDNPMLRFYKKLIQIRKSNPVLQSGDPVILLANDGTKTFAYSRTLGQDIALVAINRSENSQTVEIPLPVAARVGLVDALTGKTYSAAGATVKVELPALSAAILLPPKAAAR